MSISSECSPHQLVQSLSGVTATGSPGIELSESNGGVHHLSKDSSDASSDHTFVLQPWNVPLMKRIFLNEHNFRTESKVDILKATRSGTSWQPDVSDTGILDQLLVSEIFDTIAGPDHTLLAFFVDLEYNEKAEYKRQASISKASLAKLIGHMEIHDAAVQNLLARPDYWSAFARGKDIAGGITASYEFFCQHPRWLQKTRFDKSQHRAPCSVYLHHDNISNTTYYLISSARDEKVAPKILEELNIPSPDKPHTGSSIEALANPFLIHTLVSGYAHLQSVDYLADVRERLFSQIAEVNDYSKEPYSGSPLGSRGNDGREKLQNITKNLHAVSQTCDSGIANADMSIRLCEEMLEAYIAFSTDPKTPPKSWRQVRDSMGWILKTWHCQKNWLVSYKARKDTAMNFVYNLVTQQDNSINIDIAHQAAEHSSSMNAITILTMVSLPGTFLAGIFGSGILNINDAHGISSIFWPFIFILLPLTLLIGALWFWRQRLERCYSWGKKRLSNTRRHKDIEKGNENV